MNLDLNYLGLKTNKNIYRNLSVDELVKFSLEREDVVLSKTGALSVTTGKYTGRSPKDKFIVDREEIRSDIAWGKVNVPISIENYNKIKERLINYLSDKDLFIFDGLSGADRKYSKKFRIINELPSQNLFIHQLLIRPTKEELDNYNNPDYTILVCPTLKLEKEKYGINSEAAIVIDYVENIILIAGTGYAGEIKKSVFSTMNYCLTKMGVLPMHCSANIDPITHESAIFFGLSGTGKTTLSADPSRMLIGDDEHGFSEDSIFNLEGGCYAKCINLSKESEPDIYNAIRYGAVVENVILNKETKEFDFSDDSLTENTRVAYPIDYIKNSVKEGVGPIPKVIIFLTADAFGVLPPISRLNKNQAMYHFITGFTSKLSGTERGVKNPEPTFSTLFGEPFMPMNPKIYAHMLGERLDKYGIDVYLVNTGWIGGKASDGAKRIKLEYTRQMVKEALNGTLKSAKFKHNDIFNLDYPVEINDIPNEILDPSLAWKSIDEYISASNALAKLFMDNFNSKYPDMDLSIVSAGPKPIIK